MASHNLLAAQSEKAELVMGSAPVPSDRPTTLANLTDGMMKLYCACGVVLVYKPSPGEPRVRNCYYCQRPFRYSDDPPPPAPAPNRPQPAQRREPVRTNGAAHVDDEEDEQPGGRVPIAYITDLDCMLCGYNIARVRHPQPRYQATRAHDRMRCQRCGGNPIRGETTVIFTFLDSQDRQLRFGAA